MIDDELIATVVALLESSKKTIALTGAGISVESGIAPFRGNGGLWEKYDPYEYAHIESFMSNPEKSWLMLKEMGKQIFQASPNSAHHGLTFLQQQGILGSIITQNVDNLHQEAGSRNVIEFHGNYKKLVCMSCGNQVLFEKERIADIPPPPQCDCGFTFKPNVVLFGESPPLELLKQSEKEVFTCDVLLVIGSSSLVYPAAYLPVIAKKHHASIIEINTEQTELTSTFSDVFLQGSAGSIISLIQDHIKKK